MIDTGRSVKIFLINSKQEILLQLRDEKPDIYFPGYWDLFGGAVDKGESLVDAIQRELKEEINFKADNIRMIGTLFFKEKNHVLTFFKGELNVITEEIELTEGQKAEYFKLEDLLKLKIPGFLKHFINNNKEEFY